MKHTGKNNKYMLRDSYPYVNPWSNSRLFFAGSLSLGLLTLFLLVPPSEVQAERSHETPGEQQLHPLIADQSYSSSNPTNISAGFELVDPAAEQAPQTTIRNWKTITVARGDTLTHIFKKAGLQSSDAFELIASGEEAKQLSRIHPGHEVDFDISSEGKLSALRYRKSVLESRIFSRTESGFEVETIVREPDRQIEYTQASLNDSLFLAGKRAGLDQGVIMQLASVFGGVIDFVFDPRKGDSFTIMYEKLYLDGENIGSGNILAAEYVNAGEAFIAYRYEDSEGNAGYFAPDGVSMQKAFLRAPLDFKRISSNFNLRRVHPIHKRIKAHRGIDYAAPRGTPVFSAGDGRVLTSGYSRANGNYIVVSHGPQYTTKYLHLHKRHVKRHSKVKKGEIIGSVGSTGYSTGPHLHYEFLMNGVHRNPRTILKKLPKAKSIAKAEMQRFKESITELQIQMVKQQQAYQLASLDPEEFTLVRPQASANAGH